MSAPARVSESGTILDVVNALADREGEREIRLENFSIRLDGTRLVRRRMRGRSEEGKRAHSDRSVRRTKA